MNLEKYRNERRQPRTEEIKVPELSAYFDKGAAPVFIVRNLTAAEYGRCRESSSRQKELAKLAAVIIGGDSDAKAAALKELQQGAEVPADVAERIQMLAIGCVEPALQHSDAVFISEDFPTVFYNLTNAISRLSNQGRILGKQSASGKTRT